MEIFILVILIAIGAYTLKSRDESRRIALLGSHLGKYQIEKLMESLTGGYMRALGEDDPDRREQIWSLLSIPTGWDHRQYKPQICPRWSHLLTTG